MDDAQIQAARELAELMGLTEVETRAALYSCWVRYPEVIGMVREIKELLRG